MKPLAASVFSVAEKPEGTLVTDLARLDNDGIRFFAGGVGVEEWVHGFGIDAVVQKGSSGRQQGSWKT